MKDVVLIDIRAEVVEDGLAEFFAVGHDLNKLSETFPDRFRSEEAFFAKMESSVVLPAPEGPMIASIDPGLQ